MNRSLIKNSFLAILLTFALDGSAYCDTYSALLANGDTLTVDMTAVKASTPSGKSEIRPTIAWTETGKWGSVSGNSYAFSWSNYPQDKNGNLYENNPAQGASLAIMYAPPAPGTGCPKGAIYMAAIETGKAKSITDLGTDISITPLMGSFCGAQIDSFGGYTLTKHVNVSISGSTSTVTTASPPSYTGNYMGVLTFAKTHIALGVPYQSAQVAVSISQTGNKISGTGTFALTGGPGYQSFIIAGSVGDIVGVASNVAQVAITTSPPGAICIDTGTAQIPNGTSLNSSNNPAQIYIFINGADTVGCASGGISGYLNRQ